jgi:putative ABC transport system permease protein
MIQESLLIGFLGSAVGTGLGLALSSYLEVTGIDISSLMRNAAIMVPSRLRFQITPAAYFIGFIPGLLATLLGTLISGRGIYKRQTAQLFKEFEA